MDIIVFDLIKKTEGREGGVLNLVINNIHAHVRKSFIAGAEFQQIQLKVETMEMECQNYYCLNDIPLNLSSV